MPGAAAAAAAGGSSSGGGSSSSSGSNNSSRFKLSGPCVQSWVAWGPLVEVRVLPGDDSLPIMLQLRRQGHGEEFPLNGGLCFKTCYQLARDLACSQHSRDSACFAYKCHTRAVAPRQREVHTIEKEPLVTLISPGMLLVQHCWCCCCCCCCLLLSCCCVAVAVVSLISPGMLLSQWANASRASQKFADRDAVLQQMCMAARASGAGAGGGGDPHAGGPYG